MTGRAILVHGAASAPAMWQDAGWPELLAEIGIETTSVPLPGHGDSLLEPEATTDEAVAAVSGADPEADVLVGFSAGAALALRAAASEPDRYRKVVLLGLGDGMWAPHSARMRTAESLRTGAEDPGTRLLKNMAVASGNDTERVARYIAANPGPPPVESLSQIVASVLIVLGGDDGVGPADLATGTLADARVVTLQGVDHFRTPGAPGAMAAALDFLAS